MSWQTAFRVGRLTLLFLVASCFIVLVESLTVDRLFDEPLAGLIRVCINFMAGYFGVRALIVREFGSP